jgi:hypothetical protein
MLSLCGRWLEGQGLALGISWEGSHHHRGPQDQAKQQHHVDHGVSRTALLERSSAHGATGKKLTMNRCQGWSELTSALVLGNFSYLGHNFTHSLKGCGRLALV